MVRPLILMAAPMFWVVVSRHLPLWATVVLGLAFGFAWMAYYNATEKRNVR